MLPTNSVAAAVNLNIGPHGTAIEPGTLCRFRGARACASEWNASAPSWDTRACSSRSWMERIVVLSQRSQ